jgi:predicted transposase YbfD/YdcC
MSETVLVMAEGKVDDKSNEITALPDLMKMLDLKDAIVTADALNTQKATAAQVIAQEGDCLLPVKGNQPTLMQEVKEAFQIMDLDKIDLDIAIGSVLIIWL